MNFRFLSEIKITLPLLCLTGVMFAGTLATWSYALVLNGNVKAAMEVPEEAGEAEATDESGDSTEEAPAASPRRRSGRARRGGTAQLPEDLRELVRTKHLFGTPSDTVTLKGILGDEALINDQWMKVGDERNGIELLELMADRVVVDVFGEKRDVSIWSSLPGVASSGSRPAVGSAGSSRESFGDTGRQGRGGFSFSGVFRGGRGGRGFDPGMSDEERQALREEMRSRFGGRGGGDFGGRFGGRGGGDGGDGGGGRGSRDRN